MIALKYYPEGHKPEGRKYNKAEKIGTGESRVNYVVDYIFV